MKKSLEFSIFCKNIGKFMKNFYKIYAKIPSIEIKYI